MRPQSDQDLRERPEGSPLWPLVLVLADMAARIDRQEVETAGQKPATNDCGHHTESISPIASGAHRRREGRP